MLTNGPFIIVCDLRSLCQQILLWWLILPVQTGQLRNSIKIMFNHIHRAHTKERRDWNYISTDYNPFVLVIASHNIHVRPAKRRSTSVSVLPVETGSHLFASISERCFLKFFLILISINIRANYYWLLLKLLKEFCRVKTVFPSCSEIWADVFKYRVTVR